MDIQFIGSGEDAKAVIYYITDYITKSPLKAHVAYAALEMAVKRLAESGVLSTDAAERAKRLLQRTSFSLISNQELSAQQVVSYLMDYDDHFTSHRFANLYWTSFENLVNKTHPLQVSRADEQDSDKESDSETERTEPLMAGLASGPTVGEPALDDVHGGGAENSDGDTEHVHVHRGSGDEEQPEEVTISGSHDGTVVELSTQLADYLYRGDALEDMALWDFVAAVPMEVQKKAMTLTY
ncbi:hypothetical protein VTO73DRAFT_7159 [Trametes versicolor]